MLNSTRERPLATNIVFTSQFLKWFAYYGMISLLASFLTRGLLYSESDTINFISKYLTLVNLFIFAGSIVADKYMGIRRSFSLGILFYCLAFIFLTVLSWYTQGSSGSSRYQVLTILMFTFLSLAGTTLNSTASVLLTKAHQTENKLHTLEISYSYNYFFSNLGSACGKLLFPLFVGTSLGVLWGYRMAFSLSTTLSVICFLYILLNYKKLEPAASEHDQKPLGRRKLYLCFYICGLLAMNFFSFQLDSFYLMLFSVVLFVCSILYFTYLIFKVEKIHRTGMILALLVCLQMIVFFIYRNQVFTSLSLYPLNVMESVHIGNLTIGGEIALSFNAFWAIVGTPMVILLLGFLQKRKLEIYIGYKFVIGMFLTAISYGIFWYSAFYAQQQGLEKISIFWFFMGYAFVTIAEIFIMNLALSNLSLLVPKNLTATTLGLHYLCMGMGAILAGQMARGIALSPKIHYSSTQIFQLYEPFFLKLTYIAVIFTLVFILTTYIMKFLENKQKPNH